MAARADVSDFYKDKTVPLVVGYPASSALIRISSTVVDGDEPKATGLIRQFGRLIVPHLKQYLP